MNLKIQRSENPIEKFHHIKKKDTEVLISQKYKIKVINNLRRLFCKLNFHKK